MYKSDVHSLVTSITLSLSGTSIRNCCFRRHHHLVVDFFFFIFSYDMIREHIIIYYVYVRVYETRYTQKKNYSRKILNIYTYIYKYLFLKSYAPRSFEILRSFYYSLNDIRVRYTIISVWLLAVSCP